MNFPARVLALPADQRRLAAEAVVALAAANLLLRLLPFRLAGRLLGERGASAAAERAAAEHAAVAEKVRRALARAAARAPWRTTCLIQALAGRLMLKRRGVPCAVYFGVKREDGFAAHAWLVAGRTPVCGVAQSHGFTPIAVFTSRG